MARNIAVILLYDEDKRILLQKKDKTYWEYPGYWAFFGGQVEEGETVEEGLFRETLEELHYNLKNPERIMIHEFSEVQYSGVLHIYAEKYIDSTPLILNEGEKLGWFKIEEALKLRMIPQDKDALKKLGTRDLR